MKLCELAASNLLCPCFIQHDHQKSQWGMGIISVIVDDKCQKLGIFATKSQSLDYSKFKARLHTGMRTVEDTTNVSNVEKSLELEDEAEKSGLGDNDSRGGVDR